MTDAMRDVRLSDEQIEIVIVGLEWVRLDQKNLLNSDDPNLIKQAMLVEDTATRLQARLRRRLIIRGKGNVGNYAEKL